MTDFSDLNSFNLLINSLNFTIIFLIFFLFHYLFSNPVHEDQIQKEGHFYTIEDNYTLVAGFRNDSG